MIGRIGVVIVSAMSGCLGRNPGERGGICLLAGIVCLSLCFCWERVNFVLPRVSRDARLRLNADF